MDRTLMSLDILKGGAIGIKDEFDTDFVEFEFDLKLGKQTARNHIVLYAGDSIINRGGVIMEFKGIDTNGLLVFDISLHNGYYPSINNDIRVRPGNVAVYLDIDEVVVIGSKAIYNIDKTVEQYVFSRFNEVSEIEFGPSFHIFESPLIGVELLHDGVERKVGSRLHVDRPTILVMYSVNENKININTMYCSRGSEIPYLYKQLYKLAYDISNRPKSSNDILNNL